MKKRRYIASMLVLSMVLSAKGGALMVQAEEESTEEQTTETVTAGKTEEAAEVKTSDFTFTCTDDWMFDPAEDLYNTSTSVTASPWLPKDNGEYGAELILHISVKKNARPAFITDMHAAGLDGKAAMTGKADYKTRNIGGIDFYRATIPTGTRYMAYDDEKNAYISLLINNNPSDERIKELFSTLTFDIQPYTEESTPWYWEGTPYESSEHSVSVGPYSLTGKQLRIEAGQTDPAFDTFGSRVAVAGNDYYVLSDGTVTRYIRKDNVLKNGKHVKLSYQPEDIYTDKSGVLYTADYGYPLQSVTGKEEMTISSAADYVAVHPDGTFGISWFNQNQVKVIDLKTGDEVSHPLSGFQSISHLFVTKNFICVSGYPEDASGACLRILDQNFNEVATLSADNTSTGYYGSVSAVAETSEGLMIVDGNMRDIYFTDLTGALIGTIEMDQLLGTNYPWPSCAVTTKDGAIILALTDTRKDNSCTETVLFEITGFGQPEPETEAPAEETASEADAALTEEAPPAEGEIDTTPETEATEPDYSSKDVIFAVQTRLNELGYNSGSPDGIPGEKTYKALHDFQESKGLPVSDTITAEVYKALGL